MADSSNKQREHLRDLLFSKDNNASEVPEQVQMIPLINLHTFEGHPFKGLDDKKMQETVESIVQNGVLVPGIARPRAEGGYEIIAGHRRKRASELAGKTEVPFIIRNYSDDEATIIMVDTNIQREDLLPSEKAFAYHMKNEALKHQGKKSEKSTYELIGEKAGDGPKTVQRYICLTKLIPELLEMVDTKILGITVGEKLSFLKLEEQLAVYEAIHKTGKKIAVEQAERLKNDSQTGVFDITFLSELSKKTKSTAGFKLKAKWRKEFFGENDTDEEIEKLIYGLLCQWKQSRG